MSKAVLVLGKSGSGKSCAIENLNPLTTAIINVIGKDLPFRNTFSPLNSTTNTGSIFVSDNTDTIFKVLDYINAKRPEINVVVIDDSQYILVNHFMREHSTQGKGNGVFALYNDIGDRFWNLINKANSLRPDLFIYFLHHSELTETGETKAKTIGKMLDEKVNIEGMFTICLLAVCESGEHYFYTKSSGNTPTKTPKGMFATEKIPNDLQLVTTAINDYHKPLPTKEEKK
jgi:hypothetical protein